MIGFAPAVARLVWKDVVVELRRKELVYASIFFAGVMLAESDLAHEAGEKSLPLQDAFAVLFFVSVGMLFDPAILMRAPLAVLTVVFVIVIVKSLAAFAIVLAFGHPTRTALTISASAVVDTPVPVKSTPASAGVPAMKTSAEAMAPVMDGIFAHKRVPRTRAPGSLRPGAG